MRQTNNFPFYLDLNSICTCSNHSCILCFLLGHTPHLAWQFPDKKLKIATQLGIVQQKDVRGNAKNGNTQQMAEVAPEMLQHVWHLVAERHMATNVNGSTSL